MNKFTNKIRHYFPGGNTPQGFVSYYNHVMPQDRAKRIIILKGGPGTGKSTLMKAVAAKLAAQDVDLEILHCSSDPDSLDGVAVQELGAWILDGTSPHMVDPIHPGAVDEIVNLGAYWDESAIASHKSDIMISTAKISGHFASAYRYLSAAKSMQDQVASEYIKVMDAAGVRKECATLFERLAYTGIGQGMCRKGFLSAFTPAGMVSYAKTYADNAAERYVIHAENAYNSGDFFGRLLAHIQDCGLDAQAFYCPMSPNMKIEHIYVPQTEQFFTIENAESSGDAHTIDLNQYADIQKLPQSVVADIETQNMLADKAVSVLAAAKSEHDVLESYYAPYMDFLHISELADTVVEKFLH